MYDIVGDFTEILGDDLDDVDFVGEEYLDEFDILAGEDDIDDLLAVAGQTPAFLSKYGMSAGQRSTMQRRAAMQRAALGRQAFQTRLGLQKAKMMAASNRMKAALANRLAMSKGITRTRGATKSREWPLGFVSAAAVAAGASARITARPQVPFRIDRLVVPSDIAGLFIIDDLKVGKNSQLVSENALPARIFQETGVNVRMRGDTAQVSMDVTLAVTNISGAAATFRAAVIGPAVE